MLDKQLIWAAMALPITLAVLLLATYLRRRRRVGVRLAWPMGGRYADSPLALCGLTLALGLSITYWTAIALHDEVMANARTEFQRMIDTLEEGLRDRFDKSLVALVGFRSAYHLHQQLDGDEFRRLIDSTEIASEFPGVHGFAFIERVARERLPEFIRRRRSEDGSSAFSVRTSGEAPDLFVVKYIEPLKTNRAALGFDIGSEPVRRAAITRAMKDGVPTLSGRVTLTQDGRRGPGLLWSLPVYQSRHIPQTQAQRVREFIGLMNAPIIVDELLRNDGDWNKLPITYQVYDGGEGEGEGAALLLYDSAGSPAARSGAQAQGEPFRSERKLFIGGQTLRLRVTSSAEFAPHGHLLGAQMLALAGTLATLLAVAQMWSLLKAQRHVTLQARSRSEEQERLRLIAQRTFDAVVITDAQERIQWVNQAFTGLTGYTLEEVQGQRPGPLMQCPQTDPTTRALIRQALDQGQGCRQRILNRRKDGSEFWKDLEIQPIRSGNGVLSGFMAVQRDVSAEEASREALAAGALRLESTEAILRSAIEAIDEAFVLYDPQDRLVFFNDKYTEIYATSADLIKPGASFESIIRTGAERGQYAQAVGRVEEWVAERMASHLSGNSTIEQRLDDGRWLRVVERKTQDGHLVGFRIDITALKTAIETAEAVTAIAAAQQERLESILEGTNVGIWEWNVESGEMGINERWASMIGKTPEQLRPVDQSLFMSLIHPDDAAQVRRLVSLHFEGDSDYYEYEVRVRHRAGNWVWVQDRGRVIKRSPIGRVLLVAGTRIDISTRKWAEMALSETTATLRSVLDAAIDIAVIAIDTQHVITVFNAGARRMLGYDSDDVVGQAGVHRFFEAGQLDAIRAELAQRLGRSPGNGESVQEVARCARTMQWTFVRKDKSTFPGSLLISQIRDEAGTPMGYMGIVQDVSSQIAYEETLQQAIQAAKQSSLAKSQFLANMSHELRTPMNATLGMLKLLQETDLSERQRDYAVKAEAASDTLLALLNDILDFSKVEAGKLELSLEAFSLDSMLQHLSVILSSGVGAKAVEVLYDIDAQLPDRLIADSLRLQQVLVNLGNNAVKFTSCGQVVIGVRQVPGPDAPAPGLVQVEFSITDSGIGIAPVHRERIFGGFSQAEASTTRKYGGTGLGLAISQRLVRVMGGELALQSEEGVGSRFCFTLKLPVAAAEPCEQPAPAQPIAVLLIEGQPQAAAIGARMIADLQWVGTCTDSGEAALARCQEQLHSQARAFDLVLVNWQLPGMDGWECARQLGQLWDRHRLARPKFVMTSASHQHNLSQRSAAQQAMLHALLVKPFTARMLAHAVLDPAAARAQRRPASPASDGRRQLEGVRLLVVEDNLLNQQVAQELLGSQGARVSLAANGSLGVQAVATANPPFDAILMDIQMPVMDGLEATQVIRTRLGLTTLPIVAMTANALASDRQTCLAAGMNEHIGKPFKLDHLVAIVRKALDAAAPGAAPIPPDPGQSAPPDSSATDLDVAGALARMDDMRDLYLRFARTFCETTAELVEDFRQALAVSRPQAALHMHTLKSTAATVGANRLSQEASRLQALCASAAGDEELALQGQALALLARQTIDALSERIEGLQAAP